MKLSIIAAYDLSKGIGFENTIPWNLKEDLKRFKSITSGKAIIMGRATFESIGKPLPDRFNIVITSKPSRFHNKYQQEQWYGTNIIPVSSFEAALIVARNRGLGHVFAIGGSNIYKDALSVADDIYLTVVFEHYEVDTYFPDFDFSKWEVISIEEQQGDEEQDIPDYAFYYLKRKRVSKGRRLLSYLLKKIPGVS